MNHSLVCHSESLLQVSRPPSCQDANIAFLIDLLPQPLLASLTNFRTFLHDLVAPDSIVVVIFVVLHLCPLLCRVHPAPREPVTTSGFMVRPPEAIAQTPSSAAYHRAELPTLSRHPG